MLSYKDRKNPINILYKLIKQLQFEVVNCLILIFKSMFKKFQVHLTHAENGYLYYEIQYGNLYFKNEFDTAFDPILDLKNWLEEISTGHENEYPIEIENGGELIHFIFKEVQNKGFLFVSDYDPAKPIMQIPTTRKEVVQNFYEAITEFANSTKYKPEEWETVYLKDKLCKHFGGVSEETLVEMLLCMNRENLITTLFKTVRWQVLVKFKQDEMIYEDSFYFADHYKNALSSEYDLLTIREKKKIIENWLNNIINKENWDGTPLKDLKSEIIEAFLKKND